MAKFKSHGTVTTVHHSLLLMLSISLQIDNINLLTHCIFIWRRYMPQQRDLGTLHLKSRQRRREIYFPKYIYIFVLSIEKRLGVNCPNLGKIIERRWSDNFTRFEWSSSRGCTNVGAYFFFKDADYRDIRGKYNSRQWLDKGLSIYYVSTFWGLWTPLVVL